jgi:DNA-binding PadR family transcriptional regulator
MTLRAVLLALLSKEPNTGYGLGRLLRGDLRHLWDARLQQIYVELAKLRAGGFLEVQTIDLPNRPSKKTYSLSPSGQRALDGWLSDVPRRAAPKDELLTRLYCLERLPGDVMIRRLEEYRDERRDDAALLEAQRGRMPRTEPSQLGPLLTIEASLARAECDMAWCNRALVTLAGDAPLAEETPEKSRRAARKA